MRRSGAPRGAARETGDATLSCVDDACLLNVFRFLTPLPDLFAAAAVCRRWRALAADGRLRLVVAVGAALAEARPWGAPGSNRHATLAAAVSASSPGQSVFLEAGEHALDDVHVTWPLALSAAPGCVLLLPPGSARGLVVHAACRLQALDVRSATLAPCVQHDAGRLRVERCALRCADAGEHPLAHLSAPILSRARGAAEANTLSVAETRCEGGAAAVRCEGGGRLVRVRVIYSPTRRASFFFEVEPAADPPADAAVVVVAALVACAPLEAPPRAAKLAEVAA